MSEETTLERMTVWQWISVSVVLLLALVARIYRIQTESVWFDESVTYLWLDSPDLITFLRAEGSRDPASLPVYYTLVYAWYHLGFTSVVGVRMLSVLAGMLAVGFVYYWGRRLFGHVGGLTAAICMSFAKLQIYMSQEIRNYAVVLLFALLAMYAFHRASQTDQRKWWIANIALNVLTAYTHFFALLLLFAQGVYLVLTRPRRILWIGGWALLHAPFLAGIPLWLKFMLSASMNEAAWIPWAPLSRAFDAYYFVFAGSLQDAMDFVRVLPFGIPVHHFLGIAMMAAGAGYVAYCAYQYRKPCDPRDGYQPATALLLIVWLFVPAATLFIIARLFRPCFIERYVLHSAMALYLVAGGAVAAIPKSAMRYAAVAALLAIFAGNLVDYRRPLRHDLKSTGAVLRTEFRPDDRIVACFDQVELPMNYYANIPKSAITWTEEVAAEAVKSAQSGHRTWVWFVQVPGRFEPDQIEHRAQQSELPYKRWQFSGRWQTFLYLLEPADEKAEQQTATAY